MAPGAREALTYATQRVPKKDLPQKAARKVAGRRYPSPRRSASSSTSASAASRSISLAVSLGIDLGAYYSKVSLAVRQADGSLELYRIPFELPRDHPQFSGTPQTRPYEFPSVAAVLADGGVSVGHNASEEDLTIGLKMMMMYCAGITRAETLAELPGATKFLSAITSGRITLARMESAIRAHMELLRDVAVRYMHNTNEAQEHLKHIVITYPNFLGEKQHFDDFSKYITYVLGWVKATMSGITSQSVQYYQVSEGQGALIYMLEKFKDLAHHANRSVQHRLLRRTKEGGRNVLLADWGSSSLNLQVQNVYYDSDGRLLKVQSSFGRSWLTGTKGGSNVSNDKAREFVEEYLGEDEAGKLPSGEIAAYVQDWERKKQTIDYEAYVRDRQQITLHGKGAGPSITVDAEEMAPFFRRAFDGGLAALQQELDYLIELGRDFDILFLGGSFSNPGLRAVVEALIARKRVEALANGISQIEYTFLVDGEQYTYSSAVSAGAALSTLNVPHPVTVLGSSAIGLQVISPDAGEEDLGDQCKWTEDDAADVLFLRDSHTTFTSNDDSRNYPGRHARFELICDPNYQPRRREQRWFEYPPIQIGRPQDVLNGPFTTYDLGWSVKLQDLPSGRIQFAIRGSYMSRLSTTTSDLGLGSRPISFTLTCFGLDEDGNKRKSEEDRRWSLLLETGPESKLLAIKERCRLPIWCTRCSRALKGDARVCATCQEQSSREMAYCYGCHMEKPKHKRGHKWTIVRLDP